MTFDAQGRCQRKPQEACTLLVIEEQGEFRIYEGRSVRHVKAFARERDVLNAARAIARALGKPTARVIFNIPTEPSS
ncbi:MAG: hypothetical protein WBM14_06500 [Terracidiphilus sp.]